MPDTPPLALAAAMFRSVPLLIAEIPNPLMPLAEPVEVIDKAPVP